MFEESDFPRGIAISARLRFFVKCHTPAFSVSDSFRWQGRGQVIGHSAAVDTLVLRESWRARDVRQRLRLSAKDVSCARHRRANIKLFGGGAMILWTPSEAKNEWLGTKLERSLAEICVSFT